MNNEHEQRILQLEKSVKNMRLMLIICACIISGGLLLGIAEADRLLRIDKVEAISVTTRDITIIDSKGNRRAFLGMSRDESIASIQLFGADSVKPVIAFSSSRDGKNSSIAINDSKGKERMLIRLDNDSTSYMTQYTANGNVGNAFIVKKDKPYMYGRNLSLTDTSSKVRASFMLDEIQSFHPMLSYYDAKNKLRTRLFYSDKSVSGLALFDANVKNRALFGMSQQNTPLVLLNDSIGKPMLILPENKK
jgi:hypothetical protein